jgi:hypothetical protein
MICSHVPYVERANWCGIRVMYLLLIRDKKPSLKVSKASIAAIVVTDITVLMTTRMIG